MDFELLVLGGGSGGIATAVRAAQQGAKCALIEAGQLGGTCVNRGCVPKKVMWYAAKLREDLAFANDYGFSVQAAQPDWTALVANRERYIQRLHRHYQQRLGDHCIQWIQGTGQFLDSHTLVVGGQQYTAEKIVIATGGRPFVPPVPGAELGITSDGFFELTDRCPNQIAIVGGGYIGVELAGMLASLGAKVSLLLRHESPLQRFDAMLGLGLLEAMQQQNITIINHCEATRLAKTNTGIQLDYGRDSLSALDAVIWATGRRANTDTLDLAKAGVTVDKQGNIPTDAFENTNVPHIFAVGDVTGKIALTPVAIAAGRHLADRLYGGKPKACLDYDTIPTVIFSHPAIGTVGLTEAQAREQFDLVKIYTRTFTPLFAALSKKPLVTRMKLITVGKTEKVVGCHVMGLDADELLQGFAVAIKMGATKADFDRCIPIHPTSAEEFVTLR